MEENKLNYNADIDISFGISSSIKFKRDVDELGFNKICMTEILNADLSIAAYGEERYYLGCKDVLANVQAGLAMAGLDTTIYIYSFNYKNFILAANDSISKEEFHMLMKQFYIQFESAASSEVDVSAVSRFVVVLQEDRLIERALHSLLMAKDTQETFILTPDVLDIVNTANEDAKVLDLINFAMEHNRVVPYYQGIRNNKSCKIDKYEALMRIFDKDGNIFFPDYFLDISKKYKIYNRLSQIMIERAMTEFENRPERLSLNISAFDISSEAFRQWFIEKLKTYPNSKNIVIEFVETENYQEGMLFEFIKEVRSFGCKISADDFGSGYATYTAIIALSPAYIKIDGTIIKDVATTRENLIILRSICFMAELVGAKTIAEYVENEEIQNVLLKYGVNYSQGYLFSRPKPISEI